MRLVANVIESGGRSPEPIQESTENEEVANETNRSPAPGSLREATTFAALLLRSVDGEFRVGLLGVSQERLVLGIDG